ncbi:MAG: sugar transferase [Acidimicrobiia bacterium]|nr:sugar transferase [Acidimicrobiia bacterium]
MTANEHEDGSGGAVIGALTDVAAPLPATLSPAVVGAGAVVSAHPPDEALDAPRGLRCKRCFDVVVSLAALVVLTPVFAAVALAILIADGRPILFRQKRVGRHGEPFTMYKFRSMVPDAEERLAALQAENERNGPLFKMERDPRITRTGGFIRSTSLDELPQLFNVLNGTMSLVGPRPALYRERDEFDAELLQRETVPPGITGLWQVEARDDADFGKYSELDLRYVRERSLGMDVWLLVRTPGTLLRHAMGAGRER